MAVATVAEATVVVAVARVPTVVVAVATMAAVRMASSNHFKEIFCYGIFQCGCHIAPHRKEEEEEREQEENEEEEEEEGKYDRWQRKKK